MGWIVFFILFLFYSVKAEDLKLRKVERDIYMVRGRDQIPTLENRGFMSNAFAVLTKEGWVVIDTLSTPELSKEFVENLMRVKRASIKYVIITHYHPDHWYGVKTFKSSGAKVIAHEGLYQFYISGEALQALQAMKETTGSLYKDVELLPPDVKVKDKITLHVGGKRFEIIGMTPAHTNSDIVVYMPEEKVIFVGDLVYYKRIPFMGDRNASSKGWLDALEKLRTMDLKLLLGGHNEPMNKEAIDYTLEYINFLRNEIKKLKEEGLFVDDIKERMSENPYKKDVMYQQFHNANVYRVFNELDVEE